VPTSLPKTEITDWIGESEAAHTWHSLLTERHTGKKIKKKKPILQPSAVGLADYVSVVILVI